MPTLCGYDAANYGWVHDIDFSSSGDKLAWVSHSSSISFVDGNAPDAPQSLQVPYWLVRSCLALFALRVYAPIFL